VLIVVIVGLGAEASRASGDHGTPGGLVVAAATAAVCGLAITRWDDVMFVLGLERR
jgi:hypothetical protein